MFLLKYLILCLGCFVVGSSASFSAHFIDRCTPEDSKCIVTSAVKAVPYFAKGIPELGMEPMEPLTIDEDINADNKEMKLTFKNMKVSGLSKTKIIKIERDFAKLTCNLVFEVPIKITGHYAIGGNFLLSPVQGDGDFNIHTDNLRIFVDIRMKTFNDDEGLSHYKFLGYDYKYEPVEKVHIHLENLFNGDQTLAKPVNDFMDQNWQTMVEKIGKPVITKLVRKCVNNIGKFFIAVPSNDIEIV